MCDDDDDLGNDDDGQQRLPASPSPPFVRQREGEAQESAEQASSTLTPPIHPQMNNSASPAYFSPQKKEKRF